MGSKSKRNTFHPLPPPLQSYSFHKQNNNKKNESQNFKVFIHFVIAIPYSNN